MNLVELYQQTPVERHKDIKIHGDRVYVRTPQGTDECLLQPDGELQLISSCQEGIMADILQEVRSIKKKLGI